MTWTELIGNRTQTGKHWRDDATGKSRFEARLKTPLHYQSAIDSGVFDAEINISPQRVNTAALDGWRVVQNGWHYAIGSQSGLPGDGWLGFGGRHGQNWLKFKLMQTGYLHWPTRTWQDVGGAPTYNRANLSRQTESLTVGPPGAETSINAAALVTWQNIWSGVDVRWRVDGLQLKEEIVLSETTRNNLPLPLTNPLETYFGFVFRLDLSDVPRIVKNNVLKNKDGDFDDSDGLFNLHDASDRLLAFMPIDHAYSVPDENGEIQRVRLRKRLWKDGDGNHYLIVGAPVLELNALPAGGVLFDPTFSDQPAEATAKDTYLHGSNPTTNYGTDAEISMRPGQRHGLIDWDLSSIPATATCDDATQSLWTAVSATGTPSFDIYRMIQTWGELTATWNTYDGSNSWPGSAGASTAGTDYVSGSIGSITWIASTANAEAQATLTASAVEAYFGGTLPLSFAQTGSADTKRWKSSNTGTASNRPKLVINYTEAGRTTKNTDSFPLGIHTGISRRINIP